jgi:hypothetical protein
MSADESTTNLEKETFMQTLAFLSFELQVAQQCLRETFAESQMRVREHSSGKFQNERPRG